MKSVALYCCDSHCFIEKTKRKTDEQREPQKLFRIPDSWFSYKPLRAKLVMVHTSLVISLPINSKMNFLIILTIFIATISSNRPHPIEYTPVPIVLWHGMGDTYCTGRMPGMIKLLEEHIPGVYIKSLMLGGSEELVRFSSMFLQTL